MPWVSPKSAERGQGLGKTPWAADLGLCGLKRRPGLVLEKCVVEGESPHLMGLGSKRCRGVEAAGLDAKTDQRPQRIGVGGLVGQHHDAGMMLPSQAEQATLPRFGGGRGRAFAKVEHDQTERTRTQEHLGGFAGAMRSDVALVSRHVNDDEGVEVNAALLEIGGIKSATLRLDPRRGVALTLDGPDDRDRRRRAGAPLAVRARELDESPRGQGGGERRKNGLEEAQGGLT